MQLGYSSYGCSFHSVVIWYRYHIFIIADTNTIVKHQNCVFIKVTIKDWMGERFSGVFKCNFRGRSFEHGKLCLPALILIRMFTIFNGLSTLSFKSDLCLLECSQVIQYPAGFFQRDTHLVTFFKHRAGREASMSAQHDQLILAQPM